MQIIEIKTSELISFIESEQYKRFSPKPITKLRAVSQYYNPDAKKDDIALVIAHKKNKVLGFAGLLPRNTNKKVNLHIFSNTCWWADPKKGKTIAIPVFLKALQRCDSRMFIADATTHSKKILERTGLFKFAEPIKGIRGIMRFYLADIIRKKYKIPKIVYSLISLFDQILNVLWSPIRFIYVRKFQKTGLELKQVKTIDKEINTFIKQHSENEFLNRDPEIFHWIKKYPWIQESKERKTYNYPFTHMVKKYSLKYFTLSKKDNIIVFAAISYRDNLAKIPFIYFDKQYTKDVMDSIMLYLLKNKFDSVITFHPDLLAYFQANRMPFLFRKKELKLTGLSKQLYKKYSESFVLQDGDGDTVFT